MSEVGYIIDHQTNGRYGLQAALNQTYDIAIIDVMLLLLDVLSIIQKIRDKRINLSILILAAKVVSTTESLGYSTAAMTI